MQNIESGLIYLFNHCSIEHWYVNFLYQVDEKSSDKVIRIDDTAHMCNFVHEFYNSNVEMLAANYQAAMDEQERVRMVSVGGGKREELIHYRDSFLLLKKNQWKKMKMWRKLKKRRLRYEGKDMIEGNRMG